MDSLTGHCYPESNEYYGQAVLQKNLFFSPKFVSKHCCTQESNCHFPFPIRMWLILSKDVNKNCSSKPNDAQNTSVSTGCSLKVGASPTETNGFLVKGTKRVKPNGKKK